MSSSTSYSYQLQSQPINHHTHSCPVLPLCSQLFSYPNYSLPLTTNTTNPGSRTILTSSASKVNVSLLMTYATTKPFSQPPCFPLRCSPNLALINTPHPMMIQYTRQQTSRSSTTGYCGYNSLCLSSTSTTITSNSSNKHCLSSYSYSALISTTRPLPLTTTSTLCTVLLPFNQLFFYPNYTLPPTGDMTRIQ